CNLCVLCVSVVVVSRIPITTEAQRTQRLHREERYCGFLRQSSSWQVSRDSARRAEGHAHLVSVELVNFCDRARNLVNYLAISETFYDRIYDAADRGSLEECA